MVEGTRGYSNYELAVMNGFEGTEQEYLNSLKGEKGDTGEQGVQGIQGLQGEQGVQGEKGDAFTYEDFTEEQLALLKGDKGDKGEKGDQGEKGDKGEKGDTGSYDVATTEQNGLMSAEDKTKLSNIETGANKYVLPTAGTSLGGVKTTSTVSSTTGLTACPIISGVPYYKDTNTTYSVATTSANGLMSKEDKTKLNGLSATKSITTGTEFETGRIIDGKKEYGKRINCGIVPKFNASVRKAHGISNLYLFTHVYGVAGTVNNPWAEPIGFSTSNNIRMVIEGANIVIKTNNDAYNTAEYIAYVELYYLKN